jgi:hypothetical protein
MAGPSRQGWSWAWTAGYCSHCYRRQEGNISMNIALALKVIKCYKKTLSLIDVWMKSEVVMIIIYFLSSSDVDLGSHVQQNSLIWFFRYLQKINVRFKIE